jgi:hypothetical protein
LPPRTWPDRWNGLLRALKFNATFWLIGLFLAAATLTWYLPSWKVRGDWVDFITGTLILVGSTAILIYQRRMSAILERRARDAELDHEQLRRLFKVLKAKLEVVQSHLDLAIADCDDLRALNAEQARRIAEQSQQENTTSALERS